MRANDNLPKGVRDSLDYLATGGLGEVIGLTSVALANGAPKVQNDTDLEMALCLLASEALEARKAKKAS